MKHHAARRAYALSLLLAGALPLMHVGDALATGSGISGYSGKTTGQTCTSCHATGAALPTLSVVGSTSVAPGAMTSYTVAITGGPAVDAGIDVAASGGSLAVVSSTTKLSGGEIVHNAPTPFTMSGVSYSFNWTAPAMAGTYTLYIAALSTNGAGSGGDGMATKAVQITVATPPTTTMPTASFTMTPSPATVATVVNFDGSASTPTTGGTPAATISAYDWNFGDNSAGSGAKTTHSYATAGNYTVTLKITDSTGATATATHALMVNATTPPPTTLPTAKFLITPSPATAGVAVSFDGGASTTPNTSISSYSWNFGDGTALGTGKTTMHTYGAANTYSVKLTVTDNTGATNSATQSLVVNAPTTTPPPSTGQTLYDTNCASCHGPSGAGVKTGSGGPIIGATANQITRAIAVVPTMKSLSTLSASDIQAIAAFLQPTGSTPPTNSTGQDLYMQHCSSCHGADGKGIPNVAGGNILGESVGDIIESISEVPAMASLKGVLTITQVRDIANFLQQQGGESEDGASGGSIQPIHNSGTGDSLPAGTNNTFDGRLAPQSFSDTSTPPTTSTSGGGGEFDLLMLSTLVAVFAIMLRARRRKA